MPSLDLRAYPTITFDCYGTLIDWEAGLLSALRPLVGRSPREVSDHEILEAFLRFDEELTRGPFVSYRTVLADTASRLGEHFGFPVTEETAQVLAQSMRDWRPFAETIPALDAIRRHCRIAIISNVDDDLIAPSLQHLSVPFDEVITSEQATCYKPSSGIFQLALRRIGEPGSRVLHVAEGLSEAVPARALGMGSVWVCRSSRSAGGSDAQVHMTVQNLSELVRELEDQFGGAET